MNSTERTIFNLITEQYEANLCSMGTVRVWLGDLSVEVSYDMECGSCFVPPPPHGLRPEASEYTLSQALRRYLRKCTYANEYQEFLSTEAYRY